MLHAQHLNAKTRLKIGKSLRAKIAEGKKASARAQHSMKSFVIYREQMLKLLAFPKPVHDQVAIELPSLNGFRAREVVTWRSEYIDWGHGNTLVMDAKKHKTATIPLNAQIAAHTENLLDGRKEGFVVVSTSNRDRGKPIGPMAVWHIWRKWAVKAKLFNWEAFSPIVGRRFFACEWYHRQKLGLMNLCRIMRHKEPLVTLNYVNHLIFYEDVKREFRKFQFNFLQDDLESTPTVEDLHKSIDDVFASFLQEAQPQFRLQVPTVKPRKVAASVRR